MRMERKKGKNKLSQCEKGEFKGKKDYSGCAKHAVITFRQIKVT